LTLAADCRCNGAARSTSDSGSGIFEIKNLVVSAQDEMRLKASTWLWRQYCTFYGDFALECYDAGGCIWSIVVHALTHNNNNNNLQAFQLTVLARYLLGVPKP